MSNRPFFAARHEHFHDRRLEQLFRAFGWQERVIAYTAYGDEGFARVLGRPVPAAPPLLPLTPDSGIDDLGLVPAGRPLRALVKRLAARGVGGDNDSTATMMDAVIGEFPLRGIVGFTGGRFSHAALRRLLRVLNLGRR